MSLLASIALASLAQQFDPAEQQALARIGVFTASVESPRDANAHEHRVPVRFDVPGFCHVAGTSSASSQLVFAPVEGLAANADALEPCEVCGSRPALDARAIELAHAWRMESLTSPLEFSEPLLRMVQVDGGLAASGTVHVSLAPHVQRPLRIAKIPMGCGATCAATLPVEITHEGLDLAFEMSLKRPQPNDRNVAILLGVEGVGTLPLPFSVDMPQPWIDVEPGTLDFARSTTPHVPLVIDSRMHALSGLEWVRIPPCVELVDSAMNGARLSASVRETAIAHQPHVCANLLAVARFADAQETLTVAVRVVHRAGIADRDGRELLAGVFVPGEHVQVFRDAHGRCSLAFPDRARCLTGVLQNAQLQLVGAATIDGGKGDFSWIVDGAAQGRGPALRVSGPVLSELSSCALDWASICQ